MESLVATCWLSLLILTPSGNIHCTAGSPISESSTTRVTVQVREKDCPAIAISGGEIVTVGGESERPKEQQVMLTALAHQSFLACFHTEHMGINYGKP